MVGMLRCCAFCLVLGSSVALASVKTIVTEPPGLPAVFGGPGAGGAVLTRGAGFPATVSSGTGVILRPPVTITRNYGWPAVRAGAKTLISRSPQAAASTAVLGGLMAGVDWLMTDGALSKPGPLAGANQCFWASFGSFGEAVDCVYTSSGDACRALYQKVDINISKGAGALVGGGCYYYPSPSGSTVIQGEWERLEPNPDSPFPTRVPITPTDIDAFVDGINDPSFPPAVAPSIFDNVPGAFDSPDSVSFDGPSSMPGNPTTTTSTDHATGDITITESNPTYNFDYSTNPFSITTTTNNTTVTWKNGQPTSTTTTSDASPNPIVVGGGGAPAEEVPTDCDFMPTVCAFIDWVKEPFDQEEPDLTEFLNDEDFARSVTISGDAICPPPTILSTSKGDFPFSWQPGCDMAGLLKPWFMLITLIGAVYILLGRGSSS